MIWDDDKANRSKAVPISHRFKADREASLRGRANRQE